MTDIRQVNLKKLIAQHGGASALSRKLGYTNPSFLSQMVGPKPLRKVSEKTARSFEAKLGMPTGWLDTKHGAVQSQSEDVVKPRGAQNDTAMSKDTLIDVIRAVGRLCEAEGMNLPPARFAEIVAFAILHESDEMNLRDVLRLLKQ